MHESLGPIFQSRSQKWIARDAARNGPVLSARWHEVMMLGDGRGDSPGDNRRGHGNGRDAAAAAAVCSAREALAANPFEVRVGGDNDNETGRGGNGLEPGDARVLSAIDDDGRRASNAASFVPPLGLDALGALRQQNGGPGPIHERGDSARFENTLEPPVSFRKRGGGADARDTGAFGAGAGTGAGMGAFEAADAGDADTPHGGARHARAAGVDRSVFTPRRDIVRQALADGAREERIAVRTAMMHDAAERGDVTTAGALASGDADPSRADPRTGRTLLHHCAADPRLWRHIRAFGAGTAGPDPLARDNARLSALHVAVAAGNERGAAAVLSLLARPGSEHAKKYARWAAHPPGPASASAARGAVPPRAPRPPGPGAPVRSIGGIDLKDAEGRTALHAACAAGRHNLCEMLLGAGADPDAVDVSGSAPMHLAARCSAECLRSLLAAGASAAAVDRSGRTPQAVAAEVGHRECADLLDAARERGVGGVRSAAAPAGGRGGPARRGPRISAARIEGELAPPAEEAFEFDV